MCSLIVVVLKLNSNKPPYQFLSNPHWPHRFALNHAPDCSSFYQQFFAAMDLRKPLAGYMRPFADPCRRGDLLIFKGLLFVIDLVPYDNPREFCDHLIACRAASVRPLRPVSTASRQHCLRDPVVYFFGGNAERMRKFHLNGPRK